MIKIWFFSFAVNLLLKCQVFHFFLVLFHKHLTLRLYNFPVRQTCWTCLFKWLLHFYSFIINAFFRLSIFFWLVNLSLQFFCVLYRIKCFKCIDFNGLANARWCAYYVFLWVLWTAYSSSCQVPFEGFASYCSVTLIIWHSHF